MKDYEHTDEKDLFGIAIIGMAGRFPGAGNVGEFWRNLKDGVESIRTFTPEELAASGIDEATMTDPHFVNAGAPMPDSDSFDASFFEINAREAQVMDPQHRVFLETAWEALAGTTGAASARGGGARATWLSPTASTRTW